MARPIRLEAEGAVYHVIARGNERRAIFRDERDREEGQQLEPEPLPVYFHRGESTLVRRVLKLEREMADNRRHRAAVESLVATVRNS